MEIFAQLGADSSLIYQFVIILVVLILAKIIFLKHLEKVLFERENRTVSSISGSDTKLEEVEKLHQQYDSKIATAHKEIKKDSDQKKVEISSRLEAEYKKVEAETNQKIEAQRVAAEKEIEAQRSQIFAQSDELSKLLIDKVAKG